MSSVDEVQRLATPLRSETDLDPLLERIGDAPYVLGDARYTDMASAGMVNVGQLARERYGEDDVVLVGFADHSGSVVAAQAWGDRTETMTVPPARRGTIEALLHDAIAEPQALLAFPSQLPEWLREAHDHRAIGVVYHPEAERCGNYVPSFMGRRYDALLWFDRTRGLSPLHGVRASGRELETWPHGR